MGASRQSLRGPSAPLPRQRGLSRGERTALLLLSLYGLLALGYALGGSGFLEVGLAVSLLLAGGLRIIHRVRRRERARTRTARRLARRRAYQNYQTLSWH